MATLLETTKSYIKNIEEKFNCIHRSVNNKLYSQKVSIWEKNGQARLYVPMSHSEQANGYVELLTGEIVTYKGSSSFDVAKLQEALDYINSVATTEQPIQNIILAETDKAIALPVTLSFQQTPFAVATTNGAKVWIPKSVMSNEDYTCLKTNKIDADFIAAFKKKHAQFFTMSNIKF